jgi:hypothetical protein
MVMVHGFFEITNSKYQITNKSQISSIKSQTNFKSQTPNSKPVQKRLLFLGILNFGHCDLLVIWDLLFGIFTNSITL